eukprot:TRINITY_DN28533_c0_g1_i1.p1 TRINITY_DN28533_c0_g1~~TRINITY_DN28533_c0_g1_i1.p1  ORF type:complete len:206 (-),score=35.86 TRINITY_DN28533_c0_g1_i1:52-669(-)
MVSLLRGCCCSNKADDEFIICSTFRSSSAVEEDPADDATRPLSVRNRGQPEEVHVSKQHSSPVRSAEAYVRRSFGMEPVNSADALKVTITRGPEDPVGLAIDAIDGASIVVEIRDGVVKSWNEANPDRPVKLFDCIASLNGSQLEPKELASRLMSETTLVLSLRRPVETRVDILFGSYTSLGLCLKYSPSIGEAGGSLGKRCLFF